MIDRVGLGFFPGLLLDVGTETLPSKQTFMGCTFTSELLLFRHLHRVYLGACARPTGNTQHASDATKTHRSAQAERRKQPLVDRDHLVAESRLAEPSGRRAFNMAAVVSDNRGSRASAASLHRWRPQLPQFAHLRNTSGRRQPIDDLQGEGE